MAIDGLVGKGFKKRNLFFRRRAEPLFDECK